jgi:glycosyltransferase involved in cell wall biosynthesis
MFTDKILCACATHIIPEGEGVKRDIIAGKITKKPMKILANGNVRGIDLEHYSRSNDVMDEVAKIKEEGTFTYIFVGRIVGDKGIHELVDAFVKVHQQRPNTRLILVGSMEPHLDPLSNEVQETINTHEAIEAVGIQKDVRPWLAAADVLTFPSYREGFPNVVIEAGAMGLPAIVTDINGANEIIIAEENGIIIPSHDAEALYNAMIAMHDNQEMREKMATNARPLIAQRFDCHIVRKALYDFYASL